MPDEERVPFFIAINDCLKMSNLTKYTISSTKMIYILQHCPEVDLCSSCCSCRSPKGKTLVNFCLIQGLLLTLD